MDQYLDHFQQLLTGKSILRITNNNIDHIRKCILYVKGIKDRNPSEPFRFFDNETTYSHMLGPIDLNLLKKYCTNYEQLIASSPWMNTTFKSYFLPKEDTQSK